MDIPEILQHLETYTGSFPRAAVEEAIARRDEIIPDLLHVLEDLVERAPELDARGGYEAHLFAMFLLAQFRETRAYPLVVRLAMLPGDLLDSLCGEFIASDLGRVLASVYDGDPAGIQSIVENGSADQWARGAALDALVTLVAAGKISREIIVEYFASLFRGRLEREYSAVWDGLVSDCARIYPQELMREIERAYEEELVDPGFIGLADVQLHLAEGKGATLAKLQIDRS